MIPTTKQVEDNHYDEDLNVGDKVFIFHDDDEGVQEAVVTNVDEEDGEAYINITNGDVGWCVERNCECYWGGDCNEGYLCLAKDLLPTKVLKWKQHLEVKK